MSDPVNLRCKCGRYITRRRKDAARLEGLGWRVRQEPEGIRLTKECADCGHLNSLRPDDIFPPAA